MTITDAPPLTTHQLTPRIGAEVVGVDLAGPLDEDRVRAIRRAVLTHRVVFFRDQELDRTGHLALARALGTPTLAHPTLPSVDEHPAVFGLDSQAGASANHWHTDVTFVEQPPNLSILRAVVIPEIGGDTLWANTVAAYEDLRPDLRSLAESLTAVHSNGNDYGRVDVATLRGSLSAEQLEYLTTFVSTVYETQHPVVRIHPETGEFALLLGGFASRLVGHPTSESVDLIRTLQSYVTRPENTVRWRWRTGDVAIWDNRSTQHYALRDYGSARRRVERITTAGETALGHDGSVSRAVQGDARHYYTAS